MKKIDTSAIKEQIDLRRLAAKFATLKGRTSQAGPCPKCGDGDDRFVVYSNRFLCRICHPTYGDCFEFASWLMGFELATRAGFEAAANWLTNDNPLTLADTTPQVATPRPRPLLVPPAQQWQGRAADFVAYAQKLLWQPAGRIGLDYLLNRGLTEATIKATGLGYNPKDVNDPAQNWGVSDRQKIWLPGPGIVIPWSIDNGLHRVNIRFLTPRLVNGHEAKYIGPAGWQGANPLFNADSVTPKKPVLLVEGELCALTANQEAGDLITAVATGAKDSAQAGRWIARLAAAPLVLLAFDAEPDKGDLAARRWAGLLPYNSRRWRPLLKDVNDMHRAGLSVRDWIKAALPIAPVWG